MRPLRQTLPMTLRIGCLTVDARDCQRPGRFLVPGAGVDDRGLHPRRAEKTLCRPGRKSERALGPQARARGDLRRLGLDGVGFELLLVRLELLLLHLARTLHSGADFGLHV